jgi:branched-chain amino acid transport system ATP-binding protein
MLELADVHVRYGRVPAVKGISLRVDAGEIVSVVGPNGAGKSTTLKAITGVLAPAAGRITFLGEDIGGRSPESIVRRGIALVPEGRRIFSSLTVAENLLLGATIRRDRTAVAADVKEVLERFPILERYYDASADGLSGGEQQQLAIARALLSRPKLLLLDEPSLGLSPQMVERVFETLEALRDDGATILLVEQNAERAVELSDRAYVLRTGVVAHAGAARELLAETDFAAAYLGG